MKYRLIRQQGKRPNMEDYCFPSLLDYLGDLFVVCDGVGGNRDGEVASTIVCEELSRFYEQNNALFSSFENWIKQSLEKVQSAMQNYVKSNPESDEMSTTMALLFIDKENNKGFIAHIGDSRVYQIRNEKILFKTKDHSYVNELVDLNIITEVEALNHPKRNVITRSISARENESFKVDIAQVDIQNGDYFLLCSDGILETYKDDDLIELLSKNLSLEEISNTMSQNCNQTSNDNFTAIILQIDGLNTETSNINIQTPHISTESTQNPKSNLKWILYLGLVILLGFLAFSPNSPIHFRTQTLKTRIYRLFSNENNAESSPQPLKDTLPKNEVHKVKPISEVNPTTPTRQNMKVIEIRKINKPVRDSVKPQPKPAEKKNDTISSPKLQSPTIQSNPLDTNKN